MVDAEDLAETRTRRSEIKERWKILPLQGHRPIFVVVVASFETEANTATKPRRERLIFGDRLNYFRVARVRITASVRSPELALLGSLHSIKSKDGRIW